MKEAADVGFKGASQPGRWHFGRDPPGALGGRQSESGVAPELCQDQALALVQDGSGDGAAAFRQRIHLALQLGFEKVGHVRPAVKQSRRVAAP